jgi:tetratricopeptide (TPR) repeat protein
MVSETIESLCQKARQAVAQGNQEEARQLYQQAFTLRPDAPDVHYGLATVCFLLHDLSKAAYHFKEVTRLDPLRAGAYINLGAVYNRLDQIDDAIQVLRRGIQLDTHRAEGYYNLGLAYRRKRLLDLAIQAYHEAVRLNPRMADAHLNLANAYLEREQYALAIVHYQQALELRPRWEKAEKGLENAEAAQEALSHPADPRSETVVSAAERAPEAAVALKPLVDPGRTVDPNLHGALLAVLHQATIESENHGRSFLKILEKEIEPAIKELSSCLLYSHSTVHELDQCVQKFEHAISSMHSAQRSLVSSMEQVRNLGEQLIRS